MLLLLMSDAGVEMSPTQSSKTQMIIFYRQGNSKRRTVYDESNQVKSNYIKWTNADRSLVHLFCLHAMTTQTSSHSNQIHYSGRGRRRKGATIAARIHAYIHVFMRASSIILNNILLPFLSWYQTPQDQSTE